MRRPPNDIWTALDEERLHLVLVGRLRVEYFAKHDVLVGVEQRLLDIVVGAVLAFGVGVSVDVLGDGEVQDLVRKRLPSLYRRDTARC